MLLMPRIDAALPVWFPQVVSGGSTRAWLLQTRLKVSTKLWMILHSEGYALAHDADRQFPAERLKERFSESLLRRSITFAQLEIHLKNVNELFAGDPSEWS